MWKRAKREFSRVPNHKYIHSPPKRKENRGQEGKICKMKRERERERERLDHQFRLKQRHMKCFCNKITVLINSELCH